MNNHAKFKGKNQHNTMKKRVNFNTSQQWRLNRTNSGSAPNRKVINQNLSQIKQGLTPLKKAQQAYYGNNSRSPLLKNQTEATYSSRLPVHARLGNNGLKRLQNTVSTTVPKITVSHLVAQKRALRLQAAQQRNHLEQLGLAMRNRNFVPNKTGMRSDLMLKSQQVQHKKMNNGNVIRKNIKPNTFSLKPISDYRISVALPHNFQKSQTSVNRPVMRSMEVNPQIQREIALIQQRHHQTQTVASVLPPAIPGLTVDIHQGLNLHRTLGNPLVTTRPISVTGINRETTTTIIPQRKKISLHERFSLL